jgi:hypothetical protein
MAAGQLETISAISAVIAAVLWIASAIGKMPKKFPIRVISWHMYDGESVTGTQVVGEGFGESEELEHLGAVAASSELAQRLSGHFCGNLRPFARCCSVLFFKMTSLPRRLVGCSPWEPRKPPGTGGSPLRGPTQCLLESAWLSVQAS